MVTKHEFTQLAFLGKRKGFPVDLLRTIQGWPSDVLSANEIIETYKGQRGQNENPFVVLITALRDANKDEWRKRGWMKVELTEAQTMRRLSHV